MYMCISISISIYLSFNQSINLSNDQKNVSGFGYFPCAVSAGVFFLYFYGCIILLGFIMYKALRRVVFFWIFFVYYTLRISMRTRYREYF